MCDTVKEFSGKGLSKDEYDFVVQLRNLLDADEKFQHFRKDDSYLLRFLYCLDFNIKLTYKRIEAYCKYVRKYPEWQAHGSLLDMKDQVELIRKGFLKEGRDNDGRRLFVVQMNTLDTDKTSHLQNFWLDDYWLELVMDEPETRSTGIAVIMDTKNLNSNIIRWFTPAIMKVVGKKTDLLPTKEVIYHFVNTSKFLKTLTKLVWPFLPEKVTKRFNFHSGSTFKRLHEYINPQVLPPEYGGYGNPLDFEEMNKWLFENSAVIEEKLKHHVLIK